MASSQIKPIEVKNLGLQSYMDVWQAMQNFTEHRTENDSDELWVVEHPPVFTQGLAGKSEHILNTSNIPIVQVDRGGQVTYHGPGQLILYPLLNIKRAKLGLRPLVTALETSVIKLLKQYDIDAYAQAKAPGVYVSEQKVASLGLRIRKGCSFHGLALNVAMNLQPFKQINPCGYANMEMTQCSDLNGPATVAEAAKNLIPIFCQEIGMSFEHSQTEKI